MPTINDITLFCMALSILILGVTCIKLLHLHRQLRKEYGETAGAVTTHDREIMELQTILGSTLAGHHERIETLKKAIH